MLHENAGINLTGHFWDELRFSFICYFLLVHNIVFPLDVMLVEKFVESGGTSCVPLLKEIIVSSFAI